MQRAQDFERLFGSAIGVFIKRGLEGADIAFGIARAAVPSGRHDALVIVDLAVLDLDPMRERAARRLGEADALGFAWPALGLPILDIGGRRVARLDIGDELVLEVASSYAPPTGIRGRAPPCGQASRTAPSTGTSKVLQDQTRSAP